MTKMYETMIELIFVYRDQIAGQCKYEIRIIAVEMDWLQRYAGISRLQNQDIRQF